MHALNVTAARGKQNAVHRFSTVRRYNGNGNFFHEYVRTYAFLSLLLYLPPSLSRTPSLTHSHPPLPHSLPDSPSLLPHSSLPHSSPLTHSPLTPSLRTSLTSSLPPSLPHSLTPSLPHLLPHSLSHSPLPPSLPPPLPHSLTPSLQLSHVRHKSHQTEEEKDTIQKTMHGFVNHEKEKFERLARQMKYQKKDLQAKSAAIQQVKALIRNSPHAVRTPLKERQVRASACLSLSIYLSIYLQSSIQCTYVT